MPSPPKNQEPSTGQGRGSAGRGWVAQQRQAGKEPGLDLQARDRLEPGLLRLQPGLVLRARGLLCLARSEQVHDQENLKGLSEQLKKAKLGTKKVKLQLTSRVCEDTLRKSGRLLQPHSTTRRQRSGDRRFGKSGAGMALAWRSFGWRCRRWFFLSGRRSGITRPCGRNLFESFCRFLLVSGFFFVLSGVGLSPGDLLAGF